MGMQEQTHAEVLMVEDDEDFARLVVMSLEARGLTVDVAYNVEDATQALNAHHYKVVSLDAFLGQDNCGSLVKILKDESHLNHDALIVICSAHANDDFIKRIEAKGHRAFNKMNNLKPYYDYVVDCCGNDQLEVEEETVTNSIDQAIENNIAAELEDQISSVMAGIIGDDAGDPSDAA